MATTVGNVLFTISADLKNVQGNLRTLESDFQSSFNRISSLSGGAGIKSLENTFKTSFANMSEAAIESFASIQAAGADVFAKLEAQQKQRTLISSLATKNAGPNTARNEAVEAARFERIRQDALKASRDAFKEFEDSVRSGSANVTTAFGASTVGAKGLASSMGGLLSIAKSLGLVFGVGFAVGFVKQSIEATAALNDLAEQTGFSGETLLKLKPIANDAGSSIEEFAKSVNQFQKAIIEGSPATVEALHKIGLTANELLQFADDPEGLIGKLSKGLAGIADQATRVQVQRDLLSRGGPKLAAAFTEIEKRGGIQAIQAEPSLISNEQIAAVDRLTRSFDNAKVSLQGLVAVKFISVVDGLKEMNDWLEKIVGTSGQADTNVSTLFGHKFSIKDIADFSLADELFSGPLKRAQELQKKQQEIAAAEEASNKLGAFRNFPAPTTGTIDLAKSNLALPGAAITPAQTDAQRDFKKSLDEQIESLRGQVLGLTASKEAQIANAAAALKTKAGLIDLTEANDEFNKKLAEFKSISLQIAQGQLADQLTKSNHSLEVQIASMVQGKPAAEALALQYSILDAKLQDIGPAAEAAAKKQRELNNEQARAFVPQTKRELGEAIDTAQRKQVTLGITFNADEEVRAAVESAIDKLVSNPDPRVKKLALEAALELKPQLDTARLKSIQTELGLSLGLDKEFSAVLNRTFTNTFDLASAKVAALQNALQEARQRGLDPLNEGVQELGRRLDRARLDQAASDLAKDLNLASNEAELFGRSFDLGSANISAIQSQLEKLTRDGLSPANEEMQKLASQLRDAKVADVFSDLSKDLENAAREAEVLGGAVNLPSETVDRLTDSIKRLIAEGLDPLDPKLQDLKAQLEDAKAAEHFADAFQGIGDSFLSAFTDLADGGKLKDVMKRLVSNINRSITDALITKPFEDWIKKQTNDLFGGFLKLPVQGAGTGQSVGVPGAAGQIAGAAGQAQPAIAQTAIQALSTEATTIIQTQSVEAQTTIHALSAETTTAIEVSSAAAETAITTLGATTEAAITAIQAAAIAAIEAASAGQAVSSNSGGSALSSIPLIGSLFSSGSSAAAGGAAAGSDIASVGAGEIFSTFPALLHKGGAIGPSEGGHTGPPLRFHDGGIMGGGQIMAQQGADQTGLKPGERMIIAQDGEFVFSKEAVRQIGLNKLEKANQEKQWAWPKYHGGGVLSLSPQSSVLSTFHGGGMIVSAQEGGHIGPPLHITNVERYHDGGSVSLTEGWSSPINDFSLMSAIPVAQTGMIPAGRAGGPSGGGNSVNVANFYNPQFQNRQSVGQTSAQLTAAMEAGKRNR